MPPPAGGVEVVWLKKDVRLRDHGPLAAAAASGNRFLLLFIYEPDQLGHATVHGSHVLFANEGLADVDAQLAGMLPGEEAGACVLLCVGEATEVLGRVAAAVPVSRLLAHEETGHAVSFARDKRVRRWCRCAGIPFVEFGQTGATRGLRDRDRFGARLKAFMARPQHPTPSAAAVRGRLLRPGALPGLHCGLKRPSELPWVRHAADRPQRQRGGEAYARVATASHERVAAQLGVADGGRGRCLVGHCVRIVGLWEDCGANGTAGTCVEVLDSLRGRRYAANGRRRRGCRSLRATASRPSMPAASWWWRCGSRSTAR